MLFFTKFLATGFFSGYFKYFPGTVGTFVSMLLYIPFLFIKLNIKLSTKIFYLIIFFLFGSYISTEAEKIYDKKDPKMVVIDEFLGYFATILGIIKFDMCLNKKIKILISGFFIFRFFDILKPLFIRKLERINGGIGIMLDDFLAGIYSNFVLRIFTKFIK